MTMYWVDIQRKLWPHATTVVWGLGLQCISSDVCTFTEWHDMKINSFDDAVSWSHNSQNMSSMSLVLNNYVMRACYIMHSADPWHVNVMAVHVRSLTVFWSHHVLQALTATEALNRSTIHGSEFYCYYASMSIRWNLPPVSGEIWSPNGNETKNWRVNLDTNRGVSTAYQIKGKIQPWCHGRRGQSVLNGRLCAWRVPRVQLFAADIVDRPKQSWQNIRHGYSCAVHTSIPSSLRQRPLLLDSNVTFGWADLSIS